ncbi:conserved hypothetical protein [Luminiphilus syltensis NOR5-1B]|uniref:EamA domain-containing protein n=1 Tax=Luminiphilus syltensis NOR5-1B TaxID=565045 RepID=B8KXR8_9GAMM|nr:DMT family transporter [Luminiphilus syltensis]EED35181.1 conserved hypothetical protein [Luminiphilus syltensis NOR5-1B]
MRYYLLLLTSTLLMASGFITAKLLIVGGAPPIALVAARFTLAGGLALLWLAFIRRLQRPKSLSALLGIVLIGSLQTAVMFVLSFGALAHLDPAVVALLTFTMPLWVVALEATASRQWPSYSQLAGLILGLAGVALILGAGFVGNGPRALLAAVGVLVGAFGWAVATVFTKRVDLGVHGWSLNGSQMFVGGMLVMIATQFVDPRPLAIHTAVDAALFVWLVVPASIISFGFWFAALHLRGASQTSGFLFLVPFFTAVLAVPAMDAEFSTAQLLGGCAVGAAIWLMGRSQAPRKG